MAKPYSADLRERVVNAVARDGISRREAARRYGVGASTVITWVQRWRETGRIEGGAALWGWRQHGHQAGSDGRSSSEEDH